MSAMFLALFLLYVLVLIATVWVLVRNYRQTHNPGFLFLGAGILIWPVIYDLLKSKLLEPLVAKGPDVPLSVLSTVQLKGFWLFPLSGQLLKQ